MPRIRDPLDHVIGANLRKYRLRRGFSQEDLACRLGVTYQQIHKYETARSSLSAARLFRLSAILGVPAALFGDSAEPRALRFRAARFREALPVPYGRLR